MRLNQITVPVTDIEESERFYRLLGLRLIVADTGYRRFECPDGESTFSLDQVDEVRPGGPVVYFECDDLDGEYRRLTDAGLHFEQPPRDMPWLWREAELRDPDGHLLRLYRAGTNRRYPPWRLGD